MPGFMRRFWNWFGRAGTPSRALAAKLLNGHPAAQRARAAATATAREEADPFASLRDDNQEELLTGNNRTGRL